MSIYTSILAGSPLFLFLKDLLLFKERGREGKREGEKH